MTIIAKKEKKQKKEKSREGQTFTPAISPLAHPSLIYKLKTLISAVTPVYVDYTRREGYHNNTKITEYKKQFIRGKHRGNRIYAHAIGQKFEHLNDYFNEIIKIDTTEKTTNAIFLTLTQKYNPNSEESKEDTWKYVRNNLPRFMDKVRRTKYLNNEVIDYATTVESHVKGGCHVHALLVYKNAFKWTTNKKGKPILPRAIKNQLEKDWGGGFVDLQPVTDPKITKYIVTMELGKCRHAEDAIDQYKRGWELSEAHKQAVHQFYYARKFKMRLYRFSNNANKIANTALKKAKESNDLEKFVCPDISDLFLCLSSRAQYFTLYKERLKNMKYFFSKNKVLRSYSLNPDEILEFREIEEIFKEKLEAKKLKK